MDSSAILEIRDLTVEFAIAGERLQAIDHLSLTVGAGRTVAIVGESGSGKSVTALSLLGLLPQPPAEITSGEIWFREPGSDWAKDAPRNAAGEVAAGNPMNAAMNAPTNAPINLLTLTADRWRSLRGSRLAIVFQEPMSSLNPVYTCGFQLIEAIQSHQKLTKQAARQQAIALLQEVHLLPSLGPGLGPDPEARALTTGPRADRAELDSAQRDLERQAQTLLDRYPHQLSGGQIQRLTIAMALAGNPAVLVADEPTTALDVTVQAAILRLLQELRDRRGMSILFVTHDLGIVAEIADDVVVMYRGQVVETGPVADIFDRPQHPYTQGLLACRPQPDRRLRLLPTVADYVAATEAAAGSETAAPTTSQTSEEISTDEMADRLQTLQNQPPLLSIANLSVAYPVRGGFGLPRGHWLAVNQVSFDVYPGETLGLVGESGCGKSTLARTIVQLIRPRSGEIRFEGQDLLSLRGAALRQRRRDLQIIFQDPAGALDPRLTVGAAIAEPLVLHSKRPQAHQTRDRVAELLTLVGLEPSAARNYPHEFSGGQRQRICIARALALSPKFVICDESVSALDVSVQAQILNLLKELQAKLGLTYIFISHDLAVVKFMSDRIAVMNRGQIEELGPADQIYYQPTKDYTRQLIAAIPKGDYRQRSA